MLREAAAAIEPVRDQVTAIGAVAVQVALSPDVSAVAPTLDVDFALPGGVGAAEDVRRIIRALQQANMQPSDKAGETGFTWIGVDSKIQLVKGFTPFGKSPLNRIPTQAGIEDFLAERISIAFAEQPSTLRFHCVNAASLLGLKYRAFGRSDHLGRPIERDFADAHLLMRFAASDIVDVLPRVPSVVRRHCVEVAAELGEPASPAARRAAVELDRSGLTADVESALNDVRRAAVRLGRMISAL